MSRWTREKFRRIILDMHLPDFSPELGRKLDARRIVDCMAKAGCEILVLPAKNHFGLTSYSTNVGTKHPNIKGDLFAKVVELAHQRGMRVMAYYSVGWDEAYRRRNAGCEQKTLLGTQVMMPPLLGYGAPWTLLCLNTHYKDHCFDQIKELCAYPIDGFWLDITFYPTFTCYCRSCRKSFRNRTGRKIPKLDWDDPLWREFVEFKSDIISDFFERTAQIAHAKDPDMPITHNLPPPDSWATSGQQACVSRQVQHMTYLASEVHLDMYGTLSLTVQVEVNKALADDPPEIVFCRFADGWDWTIKPQEQLSAECLTSLSRGAAVLVVDHVYPDGSLEDEAYDVIGGAFKRMEQLAPWVLDTTPKRFAAVHLSERTLFNYGREDPTRLMFPFYGACRTLLESHIPFCVVTDKNLEEKFEPCGVLILPNAACLSDAACKNIRSFVESGGTLLATYQTSFFNEGGEHRAAPGLAELFKSEVKGELAPVHYVRMSGGEPLVDDAPSRPIPLYAPSLLVEARSDTSSGGRIVRPFTVGERQWVTHGFAPPGADTDHPVWIISEIGAGRIIYFTGRICESLLSGAPDLRRLFVTAVARARAGIPLRVDGLRCLDVSWRVKEDADIIHLVNLQYPTGRTFPVLSPESYWKILRESPAAFPLKKLPASLFHRFLRFGLTASARLFAEKFAWKGIDFVYKLPKRGVEVADKVPSVCDVRLFVRKRPEPLANVYSPFSGALAYDEQEDGFIAVSVPKIDIHEVAVLEYK